MKNTISKSMQGDKKRVAVNGRVSDLAVDLTMKETMIDHRASEEPQPGQNLKSGFDLDPQ